MKLELNLEGFLESLLAKHKAFKPADITSLTLDNVGDNTKFNNLHLHIDRALSDKYTNLQEITISGRPVFVRDTSTQSSSTFLKIHHPVLRKISLHTTRIVYQNPKKGSAFADKIYDLIRSLKHFSLSDSEKYADDGLTEKEAVEVFKIFLTNLSAGLSNKSRELKSFLSESLSRLDSVDKDIILEECLQRIKEDIPSYVEYHKHELYNIEIDCPNLEVLDIGINKVEVINFGRTPLAALVGIDKSKLRYLNIQNSSITGVTVLSDMPVLEILSISGEQAKLFQPFPDSLKNLTVREIKGSISLPSNLETLTIEGEVIDPSPEFIKRLRQLQADGCNITVPEGLSNLMIPVDKRMVDVTAKIDEAVDQIKYKKTYQILRRYANEKIDDRTDDGKSDEVFKIQREITLFCSLIQMANKAGGRGEKMLDALEQEVSKSYANACVNQPMAAFPFMLALVSSAFSQGSTTQSSEREKIIMAKQIIAMAVIRDFVTETKDPLAISHSPKPLFPPHLQVEYFNYLYKVVVQRIQDQNSEISSSSSSSKRMDIDSNQSTDDVLSFRSIPGFVPYSDLPNFKLPLKPKLIDKLTDMVSSNIFVDDGQVADNIMKTQYGVLWAKFSYPEINDKIETKYTLLMQQIQDISEKMYDSDFSASSSSAISFSASASSVKYDFDMITDSFLDSTLSLLCEEENHPKSLQDNKSRNDQAEQQFKIPDELIEAVGDIKIENLPANTQDKFLLALGEIREKLIIQKDNEIVDQVMAVVSGKTPSARFETTGQHSALMSSSCSLTHY